MIYITQEHKLFIKTVKPSGIEDLREKVKSIVPTNLIEKEFRKDVLNEFSSATENELVEAKEETGVFFFFYDYDKKES